MLRSARVWGLWCRHKTRHPGMGVRLPRPRVRSMHRMCRSVAAGPGLVTLPRSGVAPLASPSGLQLLALDGAVTRRQLLLACQARDSLSGPAHSFVQMLVQRHRNAGPG